MLYRLLAEKVDVLSVNLSIQFSIGANIVACVITRQALMDLGHHHGLRGAEEDVVRALGPEIERLAIAKHRAGRIEEDCELVIRTADLLRYGFKGGANPLLDAVSSSGSR